MNKQFILLPIILLSLSIALAYPIGVYPSSQTACVTGGQHNLMYFNFYSGADVNKTFIVRLQNLTWISFDEHTMMQEGEIDVEPEQTVQIPVYGIISSNTMDGIYNGALMICTIPPANESIKVTWCIPGFIVYNVTSKCPTGAVTTSNITTTQAVGPTTTSTPPLIPTWLTPILVIIIAACIVFVWKRKFPNK